MERFWSKVKKSDDGCWEWQGAKINGYGRFYYHGSARKAHQIALELLGVERPPGACCCHSCDNPGCVRPSHLSWGTTQDNTADRQSKGRGIKGERVGAAKLTTEQVQEIRDTWNETQTYTGIGKKYGVSRNNIKAIVKGESWKKRN